MTKKRQQNTSEQQSTVYNKTTTLSDQTKGNNQSNTDIGTTQTSDSQPNQAEALNRDVHVLQNWQNSGWTTSHKFRSHSECTNAPNNPSDTQRAYTGPEQCSQHMAPCHYCRADRTNWMNRTVTTYTHYRSNTGPQTILDPITTPSLENFEADKQPHYMGNSTVTQKVAIR